MSRKIKKCSLHVMNRIFKWNMILRIEILKIVSICNKQAVRISIYGRPGACYVDVPAEFVTFQVNGNSIK